MKNVTLEMINELGKNVFDATKELGEINARASEKLRQKQLDTMNLYLEAGVQQMQLLGEGKSLQDVLTGQTRLAGEYSEKVLANVREAAAVATEARDEVGAWFEKGVEDVAQNMRKAADQQTA